MTRGLICNWCNGVPTMCLYWNKVYSDLQTLSIFLCLIGKISVDPKVYLTCIVAPPFDPVKCYGLPGNTHLGQSWHQYHCYARFENPLFTSTWPTYCPVSSQYWDSVLKIHCTDHHTTALSQPMACMVVGETTLDSWSWEWQHSAG